MNVKFYFAVLLSISAVLFSAEPKRPLQEGFFLDGAEGRVHYDKSEKQWYFIAQQAISDRRGNIPASQPVVLLPSSTLVQLMQLHQKDPDCQIRLWAVATEYKGQNFWFAVYYLPMSEQPTPPTALTGSSQENPSENPRKDPVLPSEIIQMIRSRPMPNLRKLDTAPTVGTDRNFIDRIGLVRFQDGKAYFQPQAFGQAATLEQFEILPSKTLAEISRQSLPLSALPRYRVSGALTEFEGKTYLLIRKAVRTFTHGNFTP